MTRPLDPKRRRRVHRAVMHLCITGLVTAFIGPNNETHYVLKAYAKPEHLAAALDADQLNARLAHHYRLKMAPFN